MDELAVPYKTLYHKKVEVKEMHGRWKQQKKVNPLNKRLCITGPVNQTIKSFYIQKKKHNTN